MIPYRCIEKDLPYPEGNNLLYILNIVGEVRNWSFIQKANIPNINNFK